MRKHSVRKWIHAILDMLPLVVIPIFAIYSHRHTIDTYSVVKEDNEVVNFNQNIINGAPNNLDSWSSTSGDLSLQSFSDIKYLCTVGGEDYNFINDTVFDIDANDKFLFKVSSYGNLNGYLSIYFYDDNDDILYSYEDIELSNSYVNVLFSTQFNVIKTCTSLELYFYDGSLPYINNIQLFNLTKMFGIGNEPTIEQFNTFFPNDYYDYTLSHFELITIGTITYNDTDIGSQFMYQMYNVTNKYFNFNSVGNFNDIYGWFETNLFNGNAPMSFFIVWNIILYEFIMDLIFLTYMLFMFIIDFAEHMIDCFFDKSYRGGR